MRNPKSIRIVKLDNSSHPYAVWSDHINNFCSPPFRTRYEANAFINANYDLYIRYLDWNKGE